MNLNLRHLEAFAAVAKLGSFTKAARSLHVSQPAFTVQIKQLEEELGVRLLDRNTRSVHLTHIGKGLAPVVERLLREIESVIADTQALSAKSIGSVTIAALPSVSATLLPPVIAQFHRQYSGITFRLREGVEKRILLLIKNEEVDFGIGCIDEADPDIHFEPLLTDRMSAVCAADSKLSRKKSVELKDLVSYPLILMDRESSVRRLVDRAFTSIGHSVTPTQEVTYMTTALGMVKEGLGVTILPSSALELRELRSLKARPILHEQLHRTVGVIQKSHRSLSPASTSFLQELRQVCQDRQRVFAFS